MKRLTLLVAMLVLSASVYATNGGEGDNTG
jgi:hypothetical protein